MRYNPILSKRPMLGCLISVAGKLLRATLIALAVVAAAYLFSFALHPLRLRWVHSDADHDGLPLIRDLDPDGDGRDLFTDPDADNDGVPNAADASAYARSMRFIPYDPLMGKYRDALGRAGMVVCIDVPVRASLAAGLAFPELLRQSAAAHPEWFRISSYNSPGNPYFYRRVRNYRWMFERHPRLMLDRSPRPGDWAFYDYWHIAFVTEVAPDGTFKLIEASPKYLRVVETTGEEMEDTWHVTPVFGRVKQ